MSSAALTKKKRIRAGHRGTAAKLIVRVREKLSEENIEPIEKHWAKQTVMAVKEKIETLRVLDSEVAELMEETEGEEEEIVKEIGKSDDLRAELSELVFKLEEGLLISEGPQTPIVTPAASQMLGAASKVKARLPKLEVKKFSGKLQEWQEFWDSFESFIDRNESLAAMDKFAYLRGLLLESAKSTIAGFALTSANYDAAVQLLKKRYGKDSAIQKVHLNDLLDLSPVYNERDTPPRLRRFCDDCETHYRGLEALGVAECVYSTIVVPALYKNCRREFA